MMDQLVKSPDFTWAMAKVFVWSCCEPFIGIVCACLPAYAPLVRRLWRRDGYITSGDVPKMYASEKSKALNKRANWSTTSWKQGTMLRGDDEIELRVNSAETRSEKDAKSSAGDLSSCPQPNEIVVTKDFFWSSSP